MSLELFDNVRNLFEQIDAQFMNRSPEESVGAQMSSFCVYSCGLFATYLFKYPHSMISPQSRSLLARRGCACLLAWRFKG